MIDIYGMIETTRLKLRLHTKEDFEYSHDLWTNLGVYQYISGKPSTLQQSWGRLYNYLGHWQIHGHGYFVIEEKKTGNFIGEIGLADFKRDLIPAMNLPYEAGWVIHPDYHNKGFATEALRALLDWNESRVGKYQAWCMIDPLNLASIKLAERFDFKFHQVGQYQGSEVHIFLRG